MLDWHLENKREVQALHVFSSPHFHVSYILLHFVAKNYLNVSIQCWREISCMKIKRKDVWIIFFLFLSTLPKFLLKGGNCEVPEMKGSLANYMLIFIPLKFYTHHSKFAGCQPYNRRCNSVNYFILVCIFWYGEKPQTWDSCQNACATFIIMYVPIMSHLGNCICHSCHSLPIIKNTVMVFNPCLFHFLSSEPCMDELLMLINSW